MKTSVCVKLDPVQVTQIDVLKARRGTGRSESIRHIIEEYFNFNPMDFIDELEKIKRQNRDLKYQMEKMLETTSDQNNKIIKVLLLLGGRDDLFKKEVMKRFPQFWKKD